MIGYCPSAGRIQPRDLLSFSILRPLRKSLTLSHNTRIVSLPLSRYRFLSSSLILSRTFSSFSSRPRATSTRLVSFVLGSMPQLTSGGGKKNRTAQWETVSTHGGERRHGLTDLLRRPRTDASARRISFLRFSPTRPLPATLSVIRDLRRDGRAPRGFNREISLTYRNVSTGLKPKAEFYIISQHSYMIHNARI